MQSPEDLNIDATGLTQQPEPGYWSTFGIDSACRLLEHAFRCEALVVAADRLADNLAPKGKPMGFNWVQNELQPERFSAGPIIFREHPKATWKAPSLPEQPWDQEPPPFFAAHCIGPTDAPLGLMVIYSRKPRVLTATDLRLFIDYATLIKSHFLAEIKPGHTPVSKAPEPADGVEDHSHNGTAEDSLNAALPASFCVTLPHRSNPTAIPNALSADPTVHYHAEFYSENDRWEWAQLRGWVDLDHTGRAAKVQIPPSVSPKELWEVQQLSLEKLPVAFSIKNSDNQLIYANNRYIEFTSTDIAARDKPFRELNNFYELYPLANPEHEHKALVHGSYDCEEACSDRLGYLVHYHKHYYRLSTKSDHEFLFSFFVENTQYKKAQSENEIILTRMKLATSAGKIGIFEIDRATQAASANEQILEILEFKPDEIKKGPRQWFERIHPDDAEKAANAANKIRQSDQVYTFEYRYNAPIGGLKHLQVHACSKLDSKGEAISTTGVVVDKTAEKTNEIKLKKAKDIAERAAETKNQFLANMSHEIRTPINGIMGMINLSLDDALAPEQKRRLGLAKDSAEQLLRIVNDILDFSKIEAGKFDCEASDFDLLHLLKSVTEPVIQVSGTQANWQLTTDFSGLRHLHLVGDAVRIRQIITNLLNNATKFCPDGPIVIRAATSSLPEGQVRFDCTIKDSGIGIPADRLPKLFTPFEQADASTTRKYGGTGLGLSIVKNLCKLMNGDIVAESQEGEGSTFKFHLTLGQSRANTQAPQPVIAAPKDILANKQILLVEDNIINQEVASAILEAYQARVTKAGNGLEALEALRQQPDTEPFDLILMDCQMPEMDGYEATGKIRNGEAGSYYQTTPIFALTANAMQEDRSKCLAAGMDEYITKPVDATELIQKLATAKQEP